MKKKSFFLVVNAAVLFLLGCGRAEPVYKYTLNDLFPKSYSDSLDKDNTHDVFDFSLCQDTRTAWDSILVINPYINSSLVGSLPFKNYAAVKGVIDDHYLDEHTCTILFVAQSKYVGYGVISRNALDFLTMNIGSSKPFTWITRRDCDKLHLKKESLNNNNFYSLQRKVVAAPSRKQ